VGLGTAIKLLREKKRETQESVAKKAGIAVPTLSHIEAGHANPTWATVRDIADALEVTVAKIADLSEKNFASPEG
jgi:transcriptional regulator with XRE-family HTH domain